MAGNLPSFRLPALTWMVAANECDRLIPLAGGGSERQLRCGNEISCDVEPLAVIEKLKKGCNGRIAENGGVFKILVGAPGAAVYSCSDDDALVTKAQSVTPERNLQRHRGDLSGAVREVGDEGRASTLFKRIGSCRWQSSSRIRRDLGGCSVPGSGSAAHLLEKDSRFSGSSIFPICRNLHCCNTIIEAEV